MVVSVVLDACVLYPIGLRDTLLNLAEAGFYRVHWTEEKMAETSPNIVEDTPGLTAEHLERTFAAMRRAFPEAMVEGYEHLVASMTNDPKDRHVLAAEVAAKADVIVTINVRHFPPSACDPHGIAVHAPDDFLCGATKPRPHLAVAVLKAQAARKQRPATSPEEMLDRLTLHVPQFVVLARALLENPKAGP